MRFLLPSCLGLFLLIKPPSAPAAPQKSSTSGQTSFTYAPATDSLRLSYKWHSRDAIETATFSISNETLAADKETFQDISDCLADIFASLGAEKKWLEKSYDVTVTFVKTKTGWTNCVNGTGGQPALAQEYLRKRNALIEADVFARRLYIKTRSGEIMPDHAAITKRYARDMKNVALALAHPRDQRRTTISRALGFLQAIPYSTSLNEIGYLSPISMVVSNKGDCDTKCAAMAAILSNYGVSAVFITVGQHMLMGIDTPGLPGDMTIAVGGVTYVLAEPTGPTAIPLGKIATDTKLDQQTLEVYGPTM